MRISFIRNLETLSASTIDKFIQDVETVGTSLGHGFDTLTPKERRLMPKLRRGGKQVVPLLAEKAQRYGATSPSASVDDMQKAFAFVEELQPLADRVGTLHTLLTDMLLVASSEGWRTARALYKVLRGIGSVNPSLAADMVPVETFFKRPKGSSKAKKNAQAPGSNPPAPQNDATTKAAPPPSDPAKEAATDAAKPPTGQTEAA